MIENATHVATHNDPPTAPPPVAEGARRLTLGPVEWAAVLLAGGALAYFVQGAHEELGGVAKAIASQTITMQEVLTEIKYLRRDIDGVAERVERLEQPERNAR